MLVGQLAESDHELGRAVRRDRRRERGGDLGAGRQVAQEPLALRQDLLCRHLRRRYRETGSAARADGGDRLVDRAVGDHRRQPDTQTETPVGLGGCLQRVGVGHASRGHQVEHAGRPRRHGLGAGEQGGQLHELGVPRCGHPAAVQQRRLEGPGPGRATRHHVVRVHVRVDEAGHEQPAGQLHTCGGDVVEVARCADGLDRWAVDQHVGVPRDPVRTGQHECSREHRSFRHDRCARGPGGGWSSARRSRSGW